MAHKPKASASPPPPVVWHCSADAGTSALSVGDKFILKCQGSAIALLRESLRIESEPKYSLVLLSAKELRGDGGEFLVTSYRVGSHTAAQIYLTDGAKKVPLTDFSWQIQSVIEQNKGEIQEPYGPFGPLRLEYPWWIWVLLVTCFLVSMLWIWRRIRKSRDRKKLLTNLAAMQTSLSPINQMAKDLRVVQRMLPQQPLPAVIDLKKQFRLYLVREFLVPAHEWSVRDVLKEIRRKRKSFMRENAAELSSLLLELDRASESKSAVTDHDVNQLIDQIRTFAEAVEEHKKVNSQ